ncbi:hypothetical protein [Pelagicoccus sp. SDUM812003]|uniref:hypothetical protein n=1 Tax=Pelagicoccus sp. SDUM812003 TaxID=3041267 RepID=UPI00281038E4|nr:hypothetical protein [Pelagicoccus sp. SDUM812003]MDQ8203192.1 hypothetical protein [Pelagicoccus sp. SDUM812003]
MKLEPARPSDRIHRFLEEADRWIDRFFEQKRNRRLPRYIPSDPLLVYSALNYIEAHQLALGKTFCEWGSGFGVSTGLASLLGYQAYGIEIQEELHERAVELAKSERIDAQFLNNSYLPEGFEFYEGHGTNRLIAPSDLKRRQRSLAYSLQYEEMDIEIEEIDIFYVYPWPEEQELMLELFDAVAAEDALLLAYFGPGDISLFRKYLDD